MIYYKSFSGKKLCFKISNEMFALDEKLGNFYLAIRKEYGAGKVDNSA
ncbi:hypothetical protein SAE01_25880 [Segetibacter aerophilus]|uniref:Uncharacterized protein n=1 Tax=Segetibacter aerophilus TaxID=670293 RepID=A0A512BDQ3_9BACT|nr:hypothetical protein SAE01_25880 [Segetibacter aerophilus]